MKSSTLKAKARLRQSLQDPVLFAKRILGHKVWSKQEEILRSVATHPRTGVKACHSSSKTFTASEATLWWLTHRKNGIVVTTAPTMTQVERLLWGEIHNAIVGGSGSTLIACETTGRRARLIELDPKYVDVIVKRWQDYTGRKAVTEGNGRTFEEIALQRS